MTMLTRIGNSQGIRIPKPLIAQAHLANVELDFEVLENGLLRLMGTGTFNLFTKKIEI